MYAFLLTLAFPPVADTEANKPQGNYLTTV